MKEQMRTQMRNQFRGNGSHMGQEVGFREAYREGYREGYEQAMRDAHEGGMNIDKMSPAELEAYLHGQRDAYGRNGAENRNQL